MNNLFENTFCVIFDFTNWSDGTTGNLIVLSLIILVFALGGYSIWGYQGQRTKEQKIAELQQHVLNLTGQVAQLTASNNWLVTEMHHRVKNNLQILSSLISSQLSYVKDDTGRDVLFSSKHRLFALSLVHQKLFEHSTASKIEMTCCIKELTDYLSAEYHIADRVRFMLDVVPLKVDVSVAIPFALILNELITNTLKFAFPDSEIGNVVIRLTSESETRYQLSYTDDGVGLPENFDFRNARSFGKTLIVGLAKQIRGDISIRNENGLEVTMGFTTPSDTETPFSVY